jgi:hypothetical protein
VIWARSVSRDDNFTYYPEEQGWPMMAREFAKIKLEGPFVDNADYKRQWCQANRAMRGRDMDRIEGYQEYVRQYNAAYRVMAPHKIKKNAKTKASRDLLRAEIIFYYSDGKNCCSSCGMGDFRVLDLDHVEGGGNKHRELSKGGTYSIYSQLKREGFPEGYQVLCRNCNWIKALEKREVISAQCQCNRSLQKTKVAGQESLVK